MGWLQVLALLGEFLPVAFSIKNIIDAWEKGDKIDRNLFQEALEKFLPKNQIQEHLDTIQRILDSTESPQVMQVEIGHELNKIVEKVGDIL